MIFLLSDIYFFTVKDHNYLLMAFGNEETFAIDNHFSIFVIEQNSLKHIFIWTTLKNYFSNIYFKHAEKACTVLIVVSSV